MSGRDNILTLGRVILAMSIGAFGVLHFLYPVFGPGIPPMLTSISFPLPGHLFWVYLTGAAFLVLAPAILVSRTARTAAAVLGLTIMVFDLLTWAPVFAVHPMEFTGNWLKDVGIAGGALILADSLSWKGNVVR
jgi:uncharacterized membrane protein